MEDTPILFLWFNHMKNTLLIVLKFNMFHMADITAAEATVKAMATEVGKHSLLILLLVFLLPILRHLYATDLW